MSVVGIYKKILREIQSGNVEVLQKFHNTYPDVHWSSVRYEKTGDTILHVASRLGHVGLVTYILDNYQPNGANCRNKDNKTPLHEAAQFGQYEVSKILIKNGANVNALKKADWTPLMLACTKIKEAELDENNYETVKVLLENQAEINYQNKDGWTVLHLIVREGDLRILELFVKFNLDINRKTKNGRTALHIAALHSKFDMMKKLIAMGLDVNMKDSCGNTPLHDCILGGNLKICDLLLENKADLHAKNRSDFTILHLAACQGDINIIEYIISVLKIDVNITTTSGLTSLHCAARNKRLEAYNYLIERGATCNVRDQFCRVPSDYLCI